MKQMQANGNSISDFELKHTLETYRMLLATSGIGAWEFFQSTNEMHCNEIYFSMLGIPPLNGGPHRKKDISQAWLDLLHPEDLEPATTIFWHFIKKNGAESYENTFRLRHTDGSWKWIWSQGRFVDDAGLDIKRVIGSHIDITRQKAAEASILEERALLRTLIDNLPDTIYIKDKEARKVIANLADVSAVGVFSESEVLGKTDLDLFERSEIAERGYRDDLSVLQYGRPILNKEEYFVDVCGKIKWLLTSKIPVFDANNRVVKLIGIGHDITQRKHDDAAILHLNEELKQQAADLKHLNLQLIIQKEQELDKALALGKFEIASEVLHDIGNALVGFGAYLTKINKVNDQSSVDPLQGLTTFLSSQSDKLEMALGGAKSAALLALSQRLLSAQQYQKTEIGTATKELLHIVAHIQDILNIQRQFVRAHEGQHDRKQVDMQGILDDCRSMLQSAMIRRGIKMDIDIPTDYYLFKGDPTRIMQVVLNILKNAMEAIKDDAAEKSISLSLKAEESQLVLIIQDSGAGFDQDTEEHLCERGFTTKANGTGLGLYNCRSIIESHQGHFSISSEGPGKGAVVSIKLPLSEKR